MIVNALNESDICHFQKLLIHQNKTLYIQL